jgi:hypothetical protein
VTTGFSWSMSRWIGVVEWPEIVHTVFDRQDRYADIALLALVLDHDPDVVTPDQVGVDVAERAHPSGMSVKIRRTDLPLVAR